ncbi:MAG TPA: type II secretion system protein [Lacipirellulaceae bacterium]
MRVHRINVSRRRVAGATPQFCRDSLGRCPRHAAPVVERRRGMSLLEITLAAGLLGVLMTVSVQMLRVMGDRQRADERRAAVLQTVQALAEQLENMPWKKLTAGAADEIAIPETMVRHLPGAKLSVSISEETEPVVAKRVTVELRWKGPRGQPAAPVRLTTWAFRDAS